MPSQNSPRLSKSRGGHWGPGVHWYPASLARSAPCDSPRCPEMRSSPLVPCVGAGSLITPSTKDYSWSPCDLSGWAVNHTQSADRSCGSLDKTWQWLRSVILPPDPYLPSCCSAQPPRSPQACCQQTSCGTPVPRCTWMSSPLGKVTQNTVRQVWES